MAEIHCTYCENNKCGFKEIISCKHRELMEENKNLTEKYKEQVADNMRMEDKVELLMKVINPILECNIHNKRIGTEFTDYNALENEMVRQALVAYDEYSEKYER